jgi:hypothetical protein
LPADAFDPAGFIADVHITTLRVDGDRSRDFGRLKVTQAMVTGQIDAHDPVGRVFEEVRDARRSDLARDAGASG